MSIEALNWALSLPFPKGFASLKFTLMCAANRADENGHCWPSQNRMAFDTAQSRGSIKRRLAELERLGLLVRLPRFISPEGEINNDGRGRQTSDELRLCITVTGIELLARMATSRADASVTETDDIPDWDGGGGSNLDPLNYNGGSQSEPPSVTPPGSQSCDPPGESLVTPPNEPSLEPKKDPPQAPPSGGIRTDTKSESEAGYSFEQWQEDFTRDATPLSRPSLCEPIFDALTAGEREHLAKATRGYLAWRAREKKPPTKLSGQNFLKERGAWPGYAAYAPPPAPPRPVFVAQSSGRFRAETVFWLIVHREQLRPQAFRGESEPGILRAPGASAAFLALAQFAGANGSVDPMGWTELLADDVAARKRLIAWREWIKPFNGGEWPALIAEKTGEFTEHEGSGSIPSYRLPKWRSYLRVPCDFPPRKDGSIGPAPPTETADAAE